MIGITTALNKLARNNPGAFSVVKNAEIKVITGMDNIKTMPIIASMRFPFFILKSFRRK